MTGDEKIVKPLEGTTSDMGIWPKSKQTSGYRAQRTAGMSTGGTGRYNVSDGHSFLPVR